MAFLSILAVFLMGLLANTSGRAQWLRAEDSSAKVSASILNDPELASGFHLLHELKFEQAREHFINWEQERPGQALGPALQAAAELYRKGMLTSEFFLDDKRLLAGIKEPPDSSLEQQFSFAVQRAGWIIFQPVGVLGGSPCRQP